MGRQWQHEEWQCLFRYSTAVRPAGGGPLFFEHYSFLGINPIGLTDAYANYETQTKAHTLINYNYCVANPLKQNGYSANCWGLTASDTYNGYGASSPTNDIGVIAPTAALSSFPYTPAESMAALKFFYYTLGDKIWGTYGFYDAFAPGQPRFASSTLAIDQGPEIIMIENYRTQLLWNLFMSAPEVKTGMKTRDLAVPIYKKMKKIFSIALVAPVIGGVKVNAQSNGAGLTIRKGLTDNQLLTLVQKQTFRYFWEGAEPVSGLARERYHSDNNYEQQDKDIIATGASGFGFGAIIVGMERGFITRRQGVQRLTQQVSFLEKADRFHGAWPHWLYNTGKVKPFGRNDDGGDLVETAYLAQGMLCARQYLNKGNKAEKALAHRIDNLWKGIEWDWYRNGDKNVLYWHWSPNLGWKMNFAVRGFNECMIMYIMAAASPTHSIPAVVYDEGWARSGAIDTAISPYGFPIRLKHNGAPGSVGPLFWAQYSYLGLNPKGR
nr:glucoamylase family protein [Mucilaginibacter humi]